MGEVRVDLNISLDGYATTTDQTPEDPIGKDWNRLVAASVATRTMREQQLRRGVRAGLGPTGRQGAGHGRCDREGSGCQHGCEALLAGGGEHLRSFLSATAGCGRSAAGPAGPHRTLTARSSP